MTQTPTWVTHLATACTAATVANLTRMRAPKNHHPKKAAVLICFAGHTETFSDAHLLLVQRNKGLRKHSGHVAFPGGGLEPDDATLRAAAYREATEETHLDTTTLTALGDLPELYLAATDFNVTPTVAWQPEPTPVAVGSPDEIHSVHWVPLRDLMDPKHRVTTKLSDNLTGPAFDLPHLFIWGFTAGLLSRYLDLAGLSQPWDHTRIVPLPARAEATLR